MPATLVATVLSGLTAAVAALLLLLLCRRARQRAGSWPAVARELGRRARTPLQGLVAAGLLMAAAELLLPAERIETQVHHLQRLEGGELELSYVLCCTGGGVDACVVQDGAGLQPGQAVSLSKTRLLGRCRARPGDGPSLPCRCS